MNYTNFSFINESIVALRGYNPNLPKVCWNGNEYSLEYMVNQICPQINAHMLNVGIGLIIAYVVVGWGSWWFFNYGWKRIPPYDTSKGFGKYIGDIAKIETRIYWDTWLKARVSRAMLFYITILLVFFL